MIGVDHAVGNGHPAASQGAAGHAVHIHTDAFWVDTNTQGTVTLTLMRDSIRIDPAALRHALAEAGVPALVTAGTICYVPGPTSALTRVISAPRHLADGSTTVTIYPGSDPAGLGAQHRLLPGLRRRRHPHHPGAGARPADLHLHAARQAIADRSVRGRRGGRRAVVAGDADQGQVLGRVLGNVGWGVGPPLGDPDQAGFE